MRGSVVRGRKKRGVICCILLLLGAAALAGWVSSYQKHQVSFFAMDTYITLSIYGKDGQRLAREAKERLLSMEGLWSATDPKSEIYAVNHSGGRQITVSPETAELLSFSLKMAERTDGALDPTIYPLLEAWGFPTKNNRVPAESEIQKRLARVGYEKVLQEGNHVRLADGMSLDLGAVAKGYAGEQLSSFLRENGVRSALLDLGRNIEAIGKRPDGTLWQIGIQDPLSEGVIGILSTADRAVVTSGAYERYFIGEDGVFYGHILDPATGYPVENDLGSVTVIGEDGGVCDALSTALFVMGKDKAIAYWRAHRDFDLILITKDRTVWMTQEADSAFRFCDGYEAWERRRIE